MVSYISLNRVAGRLLLGGEDGRKSCWWMKGIKLTRRAENTLGGRGRRNVDMVNFGQGTMFICLTSCPVVRSSTSSSLCPISSGICGAKVGDVPDKTVFRD
ncbi:hypothetical protein CEXT_180901 [Caerostris extrusa]|uniref:Uncharacterized protein n=1 Tax=Caerostris extrusa TaxID=172846 RepID=A0AAV4XBS0_CAEEX|nr:hypothetical protein CEXT_180901 [Caerostris extrusa]